MAFGIWHGALVIDSIVVDARSILADEVQEPSGAFTILVGTGSFSVAPYSFRRGTCSTPARIEQVSDENVAMLLGTLKIPEENGSLLDGGGSFLDENGSLLDENGSLLDGGGSFLDENGSFLDGSDSILDGIDPVGDVPRLASRGTWPGSSGDASLLTAIVPRPPARKEVTRVPSAVLGERRSLRQEKAWLSLALTLFKRKPPDFL